MANDESIRKMVHAIMEKRRELGIPDWGIVPPEMVIDRLNNPPPKKEDAQPETPDMGDDPPPLLKK